MSPTLIDSSWYRRPKGVPARISAGGIIVRIENSAPLVALAREGDWPEYVLPKGGVEDGETYEQAARREIEEEVGLNQLDLVAYLGKRDRLNFDRDRWMTIHYYLYTTTQSEGKPTDSAHHRGVWWFSLDDLPTMFWPEQRSLLLEQSARIHALLPANEKS
jgi:ADP-ribose pyrophosphatase YjhB (NUDIX family)